MNSSFGRGATIGVIALIVCATMWSLNGPLIKLLQRPEPSGAPGVSGIAIACYRSLLGGLIFLPLALRRWRTIRNVHLAWPIGSVVTFTLMTACFVIATTQTAAANAIILQYLSPLVVFALSPLLLHEKPRWSEGVVLLLAFVGAGVIFFGNPATELGPLTIAAFSGLGYGALTVVLRGLKAVDPAVVVALNFMGSGILMALAVPLTRGGSFELTGRQFTILALMSAVQFAAPYMLFSWALQRVEAHRASLIVLLETVLNPIWTYLIVGEPPPTATLIGGPLILASVVGWMLLSWRRQGNRIEPEEAPAAPG
jgi:DME family drug/metabolite transporter